MFTEHIFAVIEREEKTPKHATLCFFINWATKKKPGSLLYRGDEILPSYMGIIS